MEVYTTEEVVKIIRKKVEEIVLLFRCLPNENKLHVWKYWQDVTNKFQAIIIKINNPVVSESTQSTNVTKSVTQASIGKTISVEPLVDSAALLVSQNLTDIELNQRNVLEDNSLIVFDNTILPGESSITSLARQIVDTSRPETNVQHNSQFGTQLVSNTVLPVTASNNISGDGLQNIDVSINIAQDNSINNRPQLISRDESESFQLHPESQHLADDLRQLADLASGVPYNLELESTSQSVLDHCQTLRVIDKNGVLNVIRVNQSEASLNPVTSVIDQLNETCNNVSESNFDSNSQADIETGDSSIQDSLLSNQSVTQDNANHTDPQSLDGNHDHHNSDKFSEFDNNSLYSKSSNSKSGKIIDNSTEIFQTPDDTLEKNNQIEERKRKYPKRQRKSSRKDNIYSYGDLAEDESNGKKSNKENRKSMSDVSAKAPKKRQADGSEENSKTADQSVTCDVCGLRLARATSLIAHQRQHTGSRPFRCSVCSQSFTTKANMIRHENTHKGIKPFKCDKCFRSFGENKTLQSHMFTHSGEKPFGCPICGESFAQKGTLQHHIYRHTGHKGYLCSFCGKSFRQKSQLTSHKRRHEKSAPYNCNTCTSSFYSKSDLTRHQIKHTNVKPFVCDICSKSYTRLQYLKQHQNLHKGIKPYFCKECNLEFYQASQIYRHVRKHQVDKSKQVEVTPAVQNTSETQPSVVIAPEKYPIPIVTHLTPEQVNAVLDGQPMEYSEVFHIAYLEQPPDDAVAIETVAMDTSVTSTGMIETSEEVDFSAINLLANATTQLTQ